MGSENIVVPKLRVLRPPGKQVAAVQCSGVCVNLFGSPVLVLVQVLAIIHCSCLTRRRSLCKKTLLVDMGVYNPLPVTFRRLRMNAASIVHVMFPLLLYT